MTTIFLDLDGVLVDFVGPALALHRKAIPPRDVRWNFPDQVGIPQEAFWKPLGFDFWANLPWTREGRALLEAVEDIDAPFGYLTSPCQTEGCAEGKRAWARKHLPCRGAKVFIGSAKHLLAHPGALLVDDHDANVEAFRAAGGKAILVPRPWNTRREETDDAGGFDVESLANEIVEVVG